MIIQSSECKPDRCITLARKRRKSAITVRTNTAMTAPSFCLDRSSVRSTFAGGGPNMARMVGSSVDVSIFVLDFPLSSFSVGVLFGEYCLDRGW